MQKFFRNQKNILLLTLGLGVLGLLGSLFARWLRIAALALSLVLGLLTASRQAERSFFGDSHRPFPMSKLLFPAGGLCIAAAALHFISGEAGLATGVAVLDFLSGSSGIGIAETATGLALLYHGMKIQRKEAPSGAPYGILTGAAGLRLIIYFRTWDITPRMETYLVPFGASLCFLLYVSLLMVSAISMGRRRNMVLYSVLGLPFCLAALPEGTLADGLFFLGLAAFFTSELYCILGKRLRPKAAPEEPANG